MNFEEKNWARELGKGIISVEQLSGKKIITESEKNKIAAVKDLFDIRVPQIFVENSHLEIKEIAQQFVPSGSELTIYPEELEDPIGDETWTPVVGVTHRYRDRVLLKLTYMCASYCRFCFRRYKVSDSAFNLTDAEYLTAIDYIERNKDIWEVILTGGDPLTLTDQKLKRILQDLNKISHVKVIRFHTRIPTVLPARINTEFIQVLQAIQKQIIFVVHINTHFEFTKEAQQALNLLRQSGYIILMQSVLLKNINDSTEKLSLLFKTAIEHGVKPYYLHYLDLAKGVEHFRVPLNHALKLFKSLRGNISGICIPEFILDIPGGKGKIVLNDANAVNLGNNCWEFLSPLDGSKIIVQYPEKEI